MKLQKFLLWGLVPLLISCGASKLDLETVDISMEEITLIDGGTFVSLVREEKDFIALVSLAGCLACSSTRKILNSYVAENHVRIYEIDQHDYNNIPVSDFSYPLDHYPVLLFLDNGKTIDEKQNNLSDKDEVFRSIDRRLY